MQKEDTNLYRVILTFGPDKIDVKGKTYEELKIKSLKYVKQIKGFKDFIYDGPYYDEGKSKNIHLNLTIKCNLIDKEDVRKKYFMKWIERKGTVDIQQIWDLKGWLDYSKRNHYLYENSKLDE